MTGVGDYFIEQENNNQGGEEGHAAESGRRERGATLPSLASRLRRGFALCWAGKLTNARVLAVVHS